MNCDQVAELLPWYLNDSLEGAVRREVDGHLAECAACARELDATRGVFEIFDAHLPPPVLTGLVEGEPLAIPEELARRHLAACESCAEELELVRASRAAVGAEEESGGVVTPFAPRARPLPRLPAFAPPLAAAASLLAAVAVVGWLATARVASERAAVVAGLEERLASAGAATADGETNERLELARRQIAELEESRGELAERVEAERSRLAELRSRLDRALAPQLNVAVVDLFPAAALTRGAGDGTTRIARAAGEGGVVLILNSQALDSSSPPAEDAVRVELLDATGATVWSLDGLRRNPTGEFTLALPRLDLAPGDYRLRLTPEGPGETEIFPLRVVAESPKSP
ncbi:MAG: zf-HC2 domain-containing protein [Thermoanaerobaculia bacterium]|nr:zf-HC2 domain-containing protein [Thermoanaerobaculia bacterium]